MAATSIDMKLFEGWGYLPGVLFLKHFLDFSADSQSSPSMQKQLLGERAPFAYGCKYPHTEGVLGIRYMV